MGTIVATRRTQAPGFASLAALAAALSLAILPMQANAQDRGQGRRGGGEAGQQSQQQGQGGWQGIDRSGGLRVRRAPQGYGGAGEGSRASGPTMTESRNWSRRGAEGSAPQRSERGSGHQGRWSNQQQRVVTVPQGDVQANRAYGGENRHGSGRNRTYSDDARNRTYSDGGRNQDYRQSYREGRRDGWRDGVRAEDWRDRRDERKAYREGWRDSNRHDRWRADRRAYSSDYRRWDRDWRRNDRYDWNSYRRHNRHHYRLGRYYAPYHGYSYRRVYIGFSLGSLFYSSRYWIDDPWQYRLPPAYGPYRWVRYYDDALLIDLRSGEVVDAIHDFFW